MKRFTLAQITAIKTINQGHTDNLKIHTPKRKVWLSRLKIADGGVRYNNQVTVEKLVNGNWEKLDVYEAK